MNRNIGFAVALLLAFEGGTSTHGFSVGEGVRGGYISETGGVRPAINVSAGAGRGFAAGGRSGNGFVKDGGNIGG